MTFADSKKLFIQYRKQFQIAYVAALVSVGRILNV